ncbi:hypothetical protein DSM43518_01268 [Mycobacterium marinum]|uniref:DUF7159 family protein n=1 Tax=Mycobacterium marinum TaxID=1781 RepID=UPI000E3D1076|nr:hypothetical protein [Mycobacterium marinum]RFZ13414.1 hypothetical protein DSM43518_01268 [Mycobacterium marinum]
MDIVLGVSMEPGAVRLVLVEGIDADGVTVEEDTFELDTADRSQGAPAAAVAALIGTREGAIEGGYRLMSAGVTWTDPTDVAALRAELAGHDAGSVMLVSPLLAAAALAQTVGCALDYEYIAMLFVEADSATLAVVDIGDGSIVDLHRRSLGAESTAADLTSLVGGLATAQSVAEGVFVVGCGVDIVALKPVLEAATSLVVSVPEEPDMALARGAALASANAPLFASSTSALAYALDPGTGEVNPRALAPSYLDVCANADRGAGALAYSALADDGEDAVEGRRRPLVLAGSAMLGIAAFAAGLMVVTLTSDVRPAAATQPSPREGVLAPASPAAPPKTAAPVPAKAPAQVPAPGPEPAASPVPVAAPPSVVQPPPVVRAPRPTVLKPPPQYIAPATQPRRTPAPQAPALTPVQAPAPEVPPPVAVPEPAPAPPVPTQAPMTMYLHLPFVSIPIPINPPPPPAPPPEPAPVEPPPPEPGP